MHAKSKSPVTHDQVNQAISRFLSQGGVINKLPDQRTPLRNAWDADGEQVLSIFQPDLA